MLDAQHWEMVSFQDLGADAWDRKIKDVNPSPYHASWWLDILARYLPHASNISVAFRSPDDQWAFFPAILMRRFGFRKVFSLPYVAGGILGQVAPDVVTQVRDNVLRNCDCFQITALRGDDPLLEGRGAPCYGVEVDLSLSKDALLDSFSESRRRNIRQKRDKLTMLPVRDLEQMQLVTQLYRDRMKALNSSGTHSDDVLHAVFSLPETNRRITLAECEGNIVAANISLLFHRRAEFFINASTDDNQQYKPNVKLLWDDICWAQEQGAERIYLGGAVDGTRDDPLFAYKRRWGKECVQYSLSKRLTARGVIIDGAQSVSKTRWAGRLLKLAGVR